MLLRGIVVIRCLILSMTELFATHLVLSGDVGHFQANWDHRRVPSNNVDQEQTQTSMERIAGILTQEKATLWINHDKAQRDSLTMAPGFYE